MAVQITLADGTDVVHGDNVHPETGEWHFYRVSHGGSLVIVRDSTQRREGEVGFETTSHIVRVYAPDAWRDVTGDARIPEELFGR